MEIIPDTVSEPPADTTSVSIEEPQTPQPEKSVKKKSVVKRVPSGYIVFAGEIRKTCQQENPDSSFGDISRIVGTKWRSLSKEDKERYEEKAKRLAEEQAAKQQEADRAFNESLNQNRSQSPWSDYGRSMSPGANSRPATPGGYTSGYAPGHVGPYPPGYQSPGYPGQHGYPPPPGYPPHGYPPHQQGYPQYPGMRPMMGAPVSQGQTQALPPQSIVRGVPPGIARLHPSHQYGMQQGGACPQPGQTPLTQIPSAPHPTMSPGFYPGQHLPPPAPPRPPSPMFVSVPPRTQRLLHSEAYIRYIESLNSESRTVGDFERSLTATQENTQPKSTTQLPTQWLGQGAGYHDSVVTALWALRDLMMKDTLNVQRTLSFDQL
ncbi:protein polybromo-1-like isoform X2 [Liolophura sinensis]|uniref:protein polybromo-1-like isoform X2 n=1 Tax=Liolophura sinensis TaxID=3198878 RepID=UPI003158A62A